MGLVVIVMLLWSCVFGRRFSPFVPTYFNEYFICWYPLLHDNEHTGSKFSCFVGFLCMCVWSPELSSLELKTSGFFGPTCSPQAFFGWPYTLKLMGSILLFVVNLFWWLVFLSRKNTIQSWKYRSDKKKVVIDRGRLYCFCYLRMHKLQWHWCAVSRGSLEPELSLLRRNQNYQFLFNKREKRKFTVKCNGPQANFVWKIVPCIKACKHKLFFPSTVFLLPVLKKKSNCWTQEGICIPLEFGVSRNVKSAVAHSTSADKTVLPWFS